MIIQLVLFLTAFALGVVLRVVYFLQRTLCKKTKLLPVTIILDLLWCGVAFTSFWILSMSIGGGQFYFYMLCGVIAGFSLISIWL